MKTLRILLSFMAMLLWCAATLQAQGSEPTSEKKIIITKRSVDADGTERVETLIKKGKAAENFDPEQYVKENKNDNVQVEVIVEEDERNVRIRSRDWERMGQGISWTSCSDNNAFLGVEEDSDENEDEAGLQVEIVDGSAADKAGLKNNDIILALNNTQINEWEDLTNFIEKAKPGDKVQISYSRNGKKSSVEATLGARNELNSEDKKHGFLGVSELDDDDEEKRGVSVSIIQKSAADKAGLKNGDVLLKFNDTELFDWEDISDFMEETNPGDQVNITYERQGNTNTVTAEIGEQKDWDWTSWNQNDWNWSGVQVDIREKEACLGVYTEANRQNNDASDGALVNGFTDESAARDAQMQMNDVITAVNGVKVRNHDDLWNEIAKFKSGDKVSVEYLRNGKKNTVEATLKVCADKGTAVIINEVDEEGDNRSRSFTTWNWGSNEEARMRDRRVITIHRGEGDAPKMEQQAAPAADRKLSLRSFKAYPNPTQGQVTVAFSGESAPTIVTLFDVNGRQLFREELNAFDGNYIQQFDLSEYAKGAVVIRVQQGEKVYSEQIIVN